MLIRWSRRGTTPAAAAAGVVRGGLRYGRPGATPTPVDTTGVGGPDFIRHTGWNVPPVDRPAHPPGRSVRRGRPPRVVPDGGVPRDSFSPATAVVADLIGWPTRTAVWAARLRRPAAVATTAGTPSVDLHHPTHTGWTAWAAAQEYRRGYRTGWHAHRPAHADDPVRAAREGAALGGGCSPLWGLRRRPRLAGLRRRRRHHRRQLRRHRRHRRRLAGHFGRRRRRLKPGRRRAALFRCRRLRGYLGRRLTRAGRVGRWTRWLFRRAHPNRAVRAERASALVAGYTPALVDWATYTLGYRVSLPVEYNFNKPVWGYFKLEKKRRGSGRRLKLGQHPTGVPHRDARRLRWGWFEQTTLGALLATVRAAPVGDPPVRGGLAAGAYWSAVKWGRSRWPTRPAGRPGRVFVRANKSGYAVEHDARGWGTVATAPTGVLCSINSEVELIRPVVLTSFSRGRRRRSRPGRALARPLGRIWRRLVGWAWWATTPGWWAYAAVAAGWASLAYAVVWAVFLGRAAASAAVAAAAELGRQLWRPVRRWGWRRVKTGRLYNTLNWVYSAWVVAYSSEDDHSELDVSLAVDFDGQHTADEDYNLTQENDLDFDQLGAGAYRTAELDNPLDDGWYHDFDSWWDDWTEQVEDFLLDDLPHRAGLAVRPVVDFLVRLPVWGLLEGVSLAVLTAKLEYQRVWSDLLRRGGRWAAPAVVLAWAFRAAAVAAVFTGLVTQLDYAALRVEVTVTWGCTWHETYYLGWVVFCFVATVYLVGPPGWKNFLFREVGLNNLGALAVGTHGVTDPEEYYPTRPDARYNVVLYNNLVMDHLVRDEFLWDHTDLDGAFARDYTAGGYDPARLVLAREYGYDEPPYDPVGDVEVTGFVFPFHVHTHEARSLYPARPNASEYVRAARDGSGLRTDRYVFEFGTHVVLPPFLPGDTLGTTPVERARLTDREDYLPE